MLKANKYQISYIEVIKKNIKNSSLNNICFYPNDNYFKCKPDKYYLKPVIVVSPDLFRIEIICPDCGENLSTHGWESNNRYHK